MLAARFGWEPATILTMTWSDITWWLDSLGELSASEGS